MHKSQVLVFEKERFGCRRNVPFPFSFSGSPCLNWALKWRNLSRFWPDKIETASIGNYWNLQERSSKWNVNVFERRILYLFEDWASQWRQFYGRNKKIKHLWNRKFKLDIYLHICKRLVLLTYALKCLSTFIRILQFYK